MGVVIGVVGGCGGVGATRLAVVLAARAAARGGRCLLVDLDPAGGGIDVTIGIESVVGPRWSGLHTAGGRLDPQALTAALPRWAGVSVLADDGPSSPSPQAVAQVIEAGQQIGPVVLDLARWVSPMRQVAIQRCSLVVLLSACDVSAITAAHRVVGELGEVSVVMVARGTPLAAGRGARLIAVPLAGRLAARRRRDDSPLIAGALGRAGRRIADGVLDTVGVGPDRALAPDHGDAREASGGGAMSRAVLTGEASTAIIARPKRRVDS